MVELEEVINQVKDGPEFVEMMAEFGLQKRVKAWQPGLKKLEVVWDVAGNVQTVDCQTLVARITALFYTDLWGQRLWQMRDDPDALTLALAGTFQEQAVSAAARYCLLENFSQLAATSPGPFFQALVELCDTAQFARTTGISCLKQLLTAFDPVDPDAPSLYLIPSSEEDCLELCLRPKGLDPHSLLPEMIQDMRILRQTSDPGLRQKSIVGYSWLINDKKKKTAKFLEELGIGRQNGAVITCFDPNDWLNADQRLIMAAATAVPLAGTNIARFLNSARLPRIGVLKISARDFWV